MGRLTNLVAATIAALLLVGCGSLPRGEAVPFELQDRAVAVGFGPEIRSWGIQANPPFMKKLEESVQRERAEMARLGQTGPLGTAEFLAISGGGPHGAFGAGMLCAWTEMGTRPPFKVVTGISTGALTAPFVFAGAEWDEVLREVYTRTTTKDILNERGLIGGMTTDAMADTAPMWRLVSRHVNERLLEAIAEEHRKGRVLVIGTTNLDARRAVLWNIGEIAASGKPGALDLVRKILFASAAIPAAFPPVMFDVEVDGKAFQEMHVDGGATTQVFLYPPTMQLRKEAEAIGAVRERRAWIIRNSRLDPGWAKVKRSTMSIAGRAISSLIQTQGVGDLYRIYVNALRDGIDYNLAFIPADFDLEPEEEFDPVFMSALFEHGRQWMLNGAPWQKTPPGYEVVPSGYDAAP